MVRAATFALDKSLRDGRVQLSRACCLLQATLRMLPIRHLACSPQVPPSSPATGCRSMAIPRLPWWPAAPSSLVSAGMATDVTAESPNTSQRAVTSRILSFSITAATETGLNLSWIHIFKQLGWSPASPISTSTSGSAHAGTSAPVAIRSPNCHTGIAVTSIALGAFTLSSAFARSSRACEMQMLSHLRVLFNQPQMLRLIEQ